MGEKALRSLFDRLADVGLIEPEFWRDLGIVTSERAAIDAGKRQRQRNGGAAGGSASRK